MFKVPLVASQWVSPGRFRTKEKGERQNIPSGITMGFPRMLLTLEPKLPLVSSQWVAPG